MGVGPVKLLLILTTIIAAGGCKPRSNSSVKEITESDFLVTLNQEIDEALIHLKSFAQLAFDEKLAAEIVGNTAPGPTTETALSLDQNAQNQGQPGQSPVPNSADVAKKLKDQINVLRGRIVDLEAEITAVLNKGLKEQAEKLETEKCALVKAIEAMQALVEVHTAQINQNAQDISTNRDRIIALESRISLLIATIERMAKVSNPGGPDILQTRGQQGQGATAGQSAQQGVGTRPILPRACVKLCASRWSNGTCQTYGADYCAAGATCQPKCESRWSNGTCQTYGPDFCGEGVYKCILECKDRWSNGTCQTYFPDRCTRNPVCVANCGSRWSNGTCQTFSADFCGEGPQKCEPVCKERWSNGTCMTYAPDRCGAQ